MKYTTKATLIICIAVILASCMGKNSNIQFGKAPLQLAHFDFKLNIPTFFSDEAVFRDKADLTMRAEEETIEGNDTLKPIEYVHYIQYSSRNSIPVLKYRDFGFSEMELCSDLEDKETFLVSGRQENLKPKDIDRLVSLLKKDLGEPVPFKKMDRANYHVAYEWHLKDKVVKLVLDTEYDRGDEKYRNEQQQYYYDGLDTDNDEAIDKSAPTTDLQNWQKEEYDKQDEITATIFVATKQFDVYQKTSRSYRGMLTVYY